MLSCNLRTSTGSSHPYNELHSYASTSPSLFFLRMHNVCAFPGPTFPQITYILPCWFDLLVSLTAFSRANTSFVAFLSRTYIGFLFLLFSQRYITYWLYIKLMSQSTRFFFISPVAKLFSHTVRKMALQSFWQFKSNILESFPMIFLFLSFCT